VVRIEEGVVAKRRWSDLSEGTRRLIVVGAAIDGGLRIAALNDVRRRPADQLRGPKWAWVTSLALVNSAGLGPLAYALFGRRR
jgi:hypothetical protein